MRSSAPTRGWRPPAPTLGLTTALLLLGSAGCTGSGDNPCGIVETASLGCCSTPSGALRYDPRETTCCDERSRPGEMDTQNGRIIEGANAVCDDGPDTGPDAPDSALPDDVPMDAPADAPPDGSEDVGSDPGTDPGGDTLPARCNDEPLDEGLACCGTASAGEPYDPAREICCDPGSGYTAPIGQECEVDAGRCGGARPPANDAVCCGDDEVGAWFDPAAQQCCDAERGLVAPQPGNCPVRAVCGDRELIRGESCCGDGASGVPFTPETTLCCDRTTRELRPVAEGCEGPICGGFPLDASNVCCGDATLGIAFDAAVDQCCDPEAAVTAPVGTTCPTPLRCGGEAYAPPAACCGTSVYTPSVQQCCDAATSDVRTRSETCGDLPFYGIWAYATACGGDVFISDFSNGILRADGATGRITLFAEAGFPLASVCEGDTLLFSDLDAGILRKPLSGGEATLVIGGPSTAAFDMVRVGTRVAWVRNQTFSDVWVHDLATGLTTTVATNQQTPQYIATDGTWIYYVERSGFTPVVRRVRLDGSSGGTPETIVTDIRAIDEVKELLVHDGVLYIAAYGTGRVLATPADGSGEVTFFANNEVRPYALATDGERIFWRDEAAGTIRARPVDGSSEPVTVITVPGGGTRGDVVVDDLRVYAVDSGAHVVVSAPR